MPSTKSSRVLLSIKDVKYRYRKNQISAINTKGAGSLTHYFGPKKSEFFSLWKCRESLMEVHH